MNSEQRGADDQAEGATVRNDVCGGDSKVVVSCINNVGTKCRIHFLQDGSRCPMVLLSGSADAYALLKEGPFSICVESDAKVPLIVKLEEDGRMLDSDYRLLPRGSRTITSVRESFFARKRLFLYEFPIVFDNVLEREVGPFDIDLLSVKEANDISRLYRVMFFFVKGGAAASTTKNASWIANTSRELFAVATVRVGHKVPLGRFFGVTPLPSAQQEKEGRRVGKRYGLSCVKEACGARGGVKRSASVGPATSDKCGDRSTLRRLSRLSSCDSGGGHPHLFSFMGLINAGSEVCEGEQRLKSSAGGGDYDNKANALQSCTAERGNSPRPQYSLGKPPRLSTCQQRKRPALKGARTMSCESPLDENGFNESFASERTKKSTRAFLKKPHFQDELESMSANSEAREYQNWSICERCNSIFDCERRMYNTVISRLKEEVLSLKKKMAQMTDKPTVICRSASIT